MTNKRTRLLSVNGVMVNVETPFRQELTERDARLVQTYQTIRNDNPSASTMALCEYLGAQFSLTPVHIYRIIKSYGIQR